MARLLVLSQVFEGDEIMLISDKGTLVRTRTDEVSSQGRATQGVRLIKLKEGESLVGVARVEEPDELEELEATDGLPDDSAQTKGAASDADIADEGSAEDGQPEGDLNGDE